MNDEPLQSGKEWQPFPGDEVLKRLDQQGYIRMSPRWINEWERLRADWYREHNYAHHFEAWRHEIALKLGSHADDVRLLPIDRTYDLMRRAGEKIANLSRPCWRFSAPLDETHRFDEAITELKQKTCDEECYLLTHRTIDFGAIVTRSHLVFDRAFAIVGETDSVRLTAVAEQTISKFIDDEIVSVFCMYNQEIKHWRNRNRYEDEVRTMAVYGEWYKGFWAKYRY